MNGVKAAKRLPRFWAGCLDARTRDMMDTLLRMFVPSERSQDMASPRENFRSPET
jgi:hypothetical protein